MPKLFSVFDFLRFGEPEITIVRTAASESVFPQPIAKLAKLGCSPSRAGLVLPPIAIPNS